MKKVKGKALSLVLSLALVISSFSALPASASTKTLDGDLSGNDHDSIYLVNGGKDKSLVYEEFGTWVSKTPVLKTPNHKEASGVHIAAISHDSGSRLVKWYDSGAKGEKSDSISNDTDDSDIDLALRSSTVSGEEKLNILYKGTYTDDDDKEYTIKAIQKFTVRVYDKNETVIGEYSKDGEENTKGELDSSFAQKTVSHEIGREDGATDSKQLTVLKAVPSTNPVLVKWVSLATATADDKTSTFYVMKSSNDSSIALSGGSQKASLSTKDPTATAPGFKLGDDGKIKVFAPLNGYTFMYSVKHADNTTEADKAVDGALKVSDFKKGDVVTVTAHTKDADGKDKAVASPAEFKISDVSTAALAIESSKVETTTEENTGATAAYVKTTDPDNVIVTDNSATGVKYAWNGAALAGVTGDKIAIAGQADGTLTVQSTAGSNTVTNVYTFTAAAGSSDAVLAIKSSTVEKATEESTGATAAYVKTTDADNVVVTDNSATGVKYAWNDAALAGVTGGKIAIADKTDGTLTVQSTKDNGDTVITNVYTFTAAADGGSLVLTTDTTASVKLVASEDKSSVTVSNVASEKYTVKYFAPGAPEGTTTTDGTEISVSGLLANGQTFKVVAYKGTEVFGSVEAIYRVGIDGANNFVTAQVGVKAGTGKITLTAEPTKKAKDAADKDADETGAIKSSKDIKIKTSVDKKIKVDVDTYTTLSKYSTAAYLYSSDVDKDNKTSNDKIVKVSGYEISFDGDTFKDGAAIKVDKNVSITKLSGKLASVTVDSGTVQSIEPADGCLTKVHVSDAKVNNIDYGDKNGTLDVNSTKSVVGNVKDVKDVDITNGTVGNIDASGKVSVKADDEDHTVSVGDIKANEITVDSNNSKVSVGTLKPTDNESEITLSGNFVTVKAIDFDNYGAELKIDNFVGTIPAPKNATEDGATLSTNVTDDKVIINGDADINAISIGDDSQMVFTGKLNVGSIDGSGTLVVGLGKMNITSDASGVNLKFSDPTLPVGTTAFTAVSDTVEPDSMENFGFTLSKTAGSKTDTFKIASTKFMGLTFDKVSVEIAKGYSETFKATPYAPGTTIPTGNTVKYTLNGDDSIFDMVENKDGTVTVKVLDYDKNFSEQNKATLKAELVDADGDVNDDYVAGELDLTALEVPTATYKSDTGSKLDINTGATYQFKITSLDGKAPTFAVAGNAFKTTFVGVSGKDYFYKVTATGPIGTVAGVYVNHEAKPSTIITITSAYRIDTKTVTKTAGQTYQFKVTGPSQPKFQVAGIGDIKLASKSGKDYFFKVTVPTGLAKGAHGVYVNGSVMATFVVA